MVIQIIEILRFPFNKARELENMDVEGEEAEKNLIE